jgi:probable phosphoglycerate mutase
VDLYLIRHAEAAPGASDADDPGLSDRGRAQAACLAPRLAAAGIAEILHSPRRRAAETAALLGAPTTPSALLDDRTPVPSAAYRADYPARFLPWLDGTDPTEADPDGTALTSAYADLTAAGHLELTRPVSRPPAVSSFANTRPDLHIRRKFDLYG